MVLWFFPELCGNPPQLVVLTSTAGCALRIAGLKAPLGSGERIDLPLRLIRNGADLSAFFVRMIDFMVTTSRLGHPRIVLIAEFYHPGLPPIGALREGIARNNSE